MSKTISKSLIVLLVVLALVVIGYLLFRRKNYPNPNACEVRPTNSTPPTSDPNVLPGGRPEDTKMAQDNPDEYAWRLFLGINRQALSGRRGVPDPNRTIRDYDDDKPVIWET